MKIIQKTPGTTIDYEISGTKITFADDELTLNLSKYERDDPAHIDICIDKFGMLVTGVIPGIADKYAAEIDIPARRYVETPGEDDEVEDGDEDGNGEGNGEGVMTNGSSGTREPVPFDMDLCTLYLWGLEE